MEQIMSTVLGFIGGVIAWFATNYWGRTLLKFWDLRLEAHEAMFLFSDVRADSIRSLGRANEGSLRFRELGAKIEGLRSVLPAPLSWCLHKRSYDLHEGALGLIGLSNALGRDDPGATRFRVQAQRALRLPVDPQEQEQVDRERRLKDVPI
jgi:hypothetical protein